VKPTTTSYSRGRGRIYEIVDLMNAIENKDKSGYDDDVDEPLQM